MRGRASELSVIFPPAALSRGTSTPAPSPIVHFGSILIESAGVLRPLDVKSQPSEIGVLQSLPRLLSASFALVLNEGVSFLLEAMGTRMSILQFPWVLKASSNYWLVIFLEMLPTNRLMGAQVLQGNIINCRELNIGAQKSGNRWARKCYLCQLFINLGKDSLQTSYRIFSPSTGPTVNNQLLHSTAVFLIKHCLKHQWQLLNPNSQRVTLDDAVCLSYSSFVFIEQIISSHSIKGMENLERKDNRLLSSLIDLRLENVKSEQSLEEGKRKSRKMGALRAIYDSEIYENFIEIAQKKTANDKALILKSLKTHFTFSQLIQDKQLKDLLLEKFKLCKVMEGQYLMKQNSNASSFFILHDGKLSVEINGAVKRNIQPGEGFGELALLYSAPRSASIKALKSSFLWFIDRETFRNAVASMITKSYKQNRVFIQKNPFFKYLTQSQKDKLASIAINQRFEKNTEICKEGELAASMYILKSGKLGRYKAGEYKGAILKGESFEEYASLTKGCLRRQTIKVQEEADVMALGVQDIENALGKSLPLIILRNEGRNALKSSKMFEKLSEEYVQKAIDCFKLRNVKQGQFLVRKEDACRNNIFFVAEGLYLISDSSKRARIYGQSCFLDGNSVYKFEVKMKENGKVAWTTMEELVKSFGCSLNEALNNSASIMHLLEKQKNNRMTMKQQSKNLKLQDFFVLKKLGQGQFGNVFLVTDRQKQNLYALKCVSKLQTIKTKLQKHVINQKQALSLVSSPFVMQFIRSFKDEHYIYFLTEFINGIELFDTIRLIGLLNSEQTLFYGAQLLHILESLHEKSLIYRDLKPENVMVCFDGYLKLIDLGTCKKINGTEKTFTIIGTPNYMAPETLAGKGYSFPADLWSLGVVLYEFMAGFVPFGEDAEDPLQIYQEILKNPLKFPKHMKDSNMNSFISIILNKNPESRLGGSYSNLKKHTIFERIEWHQIISKKMKPVFDIPEEKLLDFSILKSKAKPLCDFLKPPPKGAQLTRKDLPSNWDAIF